MSNSNTKIFRLNQINEADHLAYDFELFDCPMCGGHGRLLINPWDIDLNIDGVECDECRGEGELWVAIKRSRDFDESDDF
ncbi:hypothetical protein Glo7428_3163 [Gloeocapsa sp. PCC 7428]|nr:hypothetical protein Glo7428_3163 [Gloeocapsa sp. PCC 7428]